MSIPEHRHSLDRAYCPRPECRKAWGEYRTIEIASNGTTTALCGPRTHPGGWITPDAEAYIAERGKAEPR